MAREQRHPAVHVDAQGALTLTVHVQPGAARTAVTGAHGDAIKVRVAARAVEGKANAVLRGFLAVEFGVPLRNVTLVRGEKGRDKVVRVEAPARRPDRAWLERVDE